MFTFTVLGSKNPFFGKFGTKNEKLYFKVTLEPQTNSNVQNSMLVLSISVLHCKYSEDFVDYVHFLCFRSEKTLLENLIPKHQISSFH